MRETYKKSAIHHLPVIADLIFVRHGTVKSAWTAAVQWLFAERYREGRADIPLVAVVYDKTCCTRSETDKLTEFTAIGERIFA